MPFDPDTDIPNLTGKVIFITGGSSIPLVFHLQKLTSTLGTDGLGLATLLELARHDPAEIYFTGPSAPSLGVQTRARLTFLPCDMHSLDSLRDTAARFTSPRLHLFIACGGIPSGSAASLTDDGYEVQFGVTHLANAALLRALLPVMEETAAQGEDVRYIALTSVLQGLLPPRGIHFDTLKIADDILILMGTGRRYAQAKLASLLYARELGRQYPAITAVAVQPGTEKEEITKAAYNLLWAATSADVRPMVEGEQMALVTPVGVPSKGVSECWDKKLAQELWVWTEKALGLAIEEEEEESVL